MVVVTQRDAFSVFTQTKHSSTACYRAGQMFHALFMDRRRQQSSTAVRLTCLYLGQLQRRCLRRYRLQTTAVVDDLFALGCRAHAVDMPKQLHNHTF